MLNQETDALEDNNKYLDSEISKYQQLAEMNQTEKLAKISELQDNIQEIKNDIRVANEECDCISDEFGSIKENVQKMVMMYQKAKFSANVSNKNSYDETTQFNEQNVTNYLSELEEYISSLITLLAYKKDDPNAAISSIPLEQLNQKDFHRKEMAIDAPIDTEKCNAGLSDAATEDAQTYDEAIIDSKALYKNFIDLVSTQKINIIQQSQAHRSGGVAGAYDRNKGDE